MKSGTSLSRTSVFTWRHAGLFLKACVKVTSVAKRELIADRLDAFRCAAQQKLRLLNFLIQDKFIDSASGLLFEFM